MTTDNEEWIDQYLSMRLDPEALRSFLQRLDNDPALRQALEEQQWLAAAAGMSALHDQLEDIHHEYTAAQPAEFSAAPSPRKIFFFNRYAAAAAILLIIAAGAALLFERSASREHQLFARYYQQPPGLPTTMGPTADPAFADAMVDYKSGDYNAAAARFLALATPPVSDTTLFYLGAAYLGAGKYDSSCQILTSVKDVSFRDQASWYRALASIRLKRMVVARLILINIVAKPDNPYQAQAAALLKEWPK